MKMKVVSLMLWMLIVPIHTVQACGAADDECEVTLVQMTHPAELVEDVLLPEWRADAIEKAKGWHLQGLKVLRNAQTIIRFADDPVSQEPSA